MKLSRELRVLDDRYIKVERDKRQIYLHHTVGGSARSTVNWWNRPNGPAVCTAYIIERDGTIYEVYDPKYWAYHLGVGGIELNATSIGIELASEGALRSGEELNNILIGEGYAGKFDANYLYAFDISPNRKRPANEWFINAKKLYHKINDKTEYVDLKNAWRGYRYFDAYDAPQVESCMGLIYFLLRSFKIEYRIYEKDGCFTTFGGNDAQNFNGVLNHANVRLDKTDTHKMFPYQLLKNQLRDYRIGTI